MGYTAELGLTGKELKAWSQNLGHEHLLTSLNCYGKLSYEEQKKSILGINANRDDKDRPATVREMEEILSKYVPNAPVTKNLNGEHNGDK